MEVQLPQTAPAVAVAAGVVAAVLQVSAGLVHGVAEIVLTFDLQGHAHRQLAVAVAVVVSYRPPVSVAVATWDLRPHWWKLRLLLHPFQLLAVVSVAALAVAFFVPPSPFSEPFSASASSPLPFGDV